MKLPAIFGDRMVLQQGRPIPVWGRADPGESITVRLAGHTARTVAGADGRWRLRLPACPAGGPVSLVLSGQTTLTFRDVLIGEVWLASGQSNMDMTVAQANAAAREIAQANHPRLRLFAVAKSGVTAPDPDATGRWEACTPATVGSFSAVAYYFGREVSGKLKVPIGLIQATWGGSMAEGWVSREALLASGRYRSLVEAYEKNRERFRGGATIAEIDRRALPRDPGNTGFREGWAAPDTDDRRWRLMELPGAWQRDGLNFSGVLWFRKEVRVPAEWAGQELALNLAPCDKHDTTYFNGVRVGGLGPENLNAWGLPRSYRVPGRLVKAGRNVIAIRIYSNLHAGGMIGVPAQMTLQRPHPTAPASLALAGPWRYRVEHDFGYVQPLAIVPNPADPTVPPYALYAGLIQPLIPYAIRGVIWYQGEANVVRAHEYRTLFPLLIRSWRRAWRQGQFPFHFVQIANLQEPPSQPGASARAELREAQMLALRLPNTGMAVTVDIGDPRNIHPANKQDVGRRLARGVLSRVYRVAGLVPCGPLFKSARRQGRRVRLTFGQVGRGLVARAGRLRGFAIAGRDRRFVWAEARIDGKTVLAWSPAVPRPVAVRYAWADNPGGNLDNQDGLPAAPFRTDGWPGVTRIKKRFHQG